MNEEKRQALEKLLLNFEPIHNNGRYWDTYELYQFYQAALSTMPRISEGELVALVQNVLAPKRQNSESMRGQSVAVARAILAKLPHLKEQQ